MIFSFSGACEAFAKLPERFFPFAKPSRGCRGGFSRLRSLREAAGAVFPVCEAFARLPERFGEFAEVPRGCPSHFCRSRESRECAEAFWRACGSPASVPKAFGMLADVPRDRQSYPTLSRDVREPSGGGRESVSFLRPFGSKRPSSRLSPRLWPRASITRGEIRVNCAPVSHAALSV